MLVLVLLISHERFRLRLEFGGVFEVKEGECGDAFGVRLEFKERIADDAMTAECDGQVRKHPSTSFNLLKVLQVPQPWALFYWC